MKVAYLHGLESSPGGPKVEWLNNTFDKVYAPAMNYKNEDMFKTVFGEIKKMNPDFIIGSSMGGYFSYLIGKTLGIPTILFNPALHSRSFEPIVIDNKGSNLNNLFLGNNDKVINPSKTKNMIKSLDGSFNIASYKGGHRVPLDVFIDSVKSVIPIKETATNNMKYIKLFEEFINERKPKGAPEFHHSDAPEAEGRFRDLSPKELAKWLIKTRDGDLKRISGSLTQQVVFNRNDDPKYADKMEKTRIEVYKQLGRDDLLEK